jgi:hypothetical protein
MPHQPVEVLSGPRTRAYWEAKLLDAERQMVVLRQVVAVGVVRPPGPTPPRGKRRAFYRKAYALWQKSLRVKASAVKRIEMLRLTKMPYYREQILRLTPTVWDRLLREPGL